MPRPALTRPRIVAAGVVVVSELGLPALDLRAVARRVNATATGVQRQIGTTELVESVVGEIVQSMPSVPERGTWSRRIRRWAIDTRRWLVGYPGLAQYLLVNRGDAAAGPDRMAGLVRVLEETGLDLPERSLTASTLYRFVLSSSDLDESMQVLGGDPLAAQIAGRDELRSAPGLSASGETADRSTVDTQFAFGLDLLIEGIGRRAGEGLLPLPRISESPVRVQVRI
jgi:AcrR family transcriptional regulator